MAESMATDEVATSHCKNCKRDISQKNFQMHELHCHRNVRLCKTCSEPVPISEMEDHNEEYHVLIECKCKKMIEKAQLEEHEQKYCSQRTAHCQFCEIDMKHVELAEHEHACGSRTEKCDDCGEFVMLKKALEHVCGSAFARDFKKTKDRSNYVDDFSPGSYGAGSFNGYNHSDFTNSFTSNARTDNLPIDVTEYLGETKPDGISQNTKGSASFKKSSARNGNNDDRFADNFQDLGISDRNGRQRGAESRVKKRAAVRSTKPQHSIVSDNGSMAIDGPARKPITKERRTRLEAKHPKVTESDSQEERSEGSLETESSEFEPVSWDEKYHHKIRKAILEKEDQAYSTRRTESPPASFTSNQSFELPCEICDALIPFAQLEVHQESCLIAQHEALRTYGTQPSKPEEVIIVDNDSDDVINLIPCEFCSIAFPVDNIVVHQPYCDMNPQKHQLIDEAVLPGARNERWQHSSHSSEDAVDQNLNENSTEIQARMTDIFEHNSLFNMPVGVDFSRHHDGRRFDPNRLIDVDDRNAYVVDDDDEILSESSSSHKRD